MSEGSKRRKMVREIARYNYERIETEKNRAPSVKLENEDTKMRIKIQSYILGKLAEGKSKSDILKRMGFVFGREKYKPYVQFFEPWVDEAIRKRNAQIKRKAQAQKQIESEK